MEEDKEDFKTAVAVFISLVWIAFLIAGSMLGCYYYTVVRRWARLLAPHSRPGNEMGMVNGSMMMADTKM